MTRENAAVIESNQPGAPHTAKPVPLRATRDHIDQLAVALSNSFAGDPFVDGWLVRNDEHKTARREHLMRVTLKELSRDLNETYTLPGLPGCAVWKRPGEHKLPLWRELLLVPSFSRVTGLARIPEVLRGFAAMEKVHAQSAPEPHYYLHIIGVTPECQGNGFGSALIGPMMARFDAEGVPAYLETFQPRNVAFYERHGFCVIEQQDLHPLPPGWFMRRDPKNRNAG